MLLLVDAVYHPSFDDWVVGEVSKHAAEKDYEASSLVTVNTVASYLGREKDAFENCAPYICAHVFRVAYIAGSPFYNPQLKILLVRLNSREKIPYVY